MSRQRTPAVGAWSRGRARCVPVERARQGAEEAAGVRMAPRGERQQPSPDHEQSLSQADSAGSIPVTRSLANAQLRAASGELGLLRSWPPRTPAGSSSRTHVKPSRRSHDHFMATPSIPVYQVAVGSAALLAAAGVTLAIVPALRRRRALVTTWVLSVSALSLAALVNLVRLMHEFT